MTDRELMQEALYALTYVGDAKEIYSDTIEALRARLAQPEPKPVAWWDGVGRFATAKEKDWDRRTGGILSAGRDIPLYTAPPQREWQGLADEEIREFEIWLDDEEEKHGWNPPADIVKYIEAKLKEKNT